MKIFNTSFIVVSLILFTMYVSNLYPQDVANPDGSCPNGYVQPKSEPKMDKNTEENFIEDNIPNVNREPRFYTDEYGSNSFNRAYYLGSGSPTKRVEVPHSSVFNNQNDDGSIEMWVYPTDLSHFNILISKGNTSAQNTFYLGASSTQLQFRIGSTFFVTPGSIFALDLNTWTHIGVTWSGGPNFTVRFYRYGLLTATVGPSAATMYTGSNGPLLIGGSNPYSSSFTEGYIDEVRFWDDMRINAEIRDNRFVGLGDYGPANTGNALTSSMHYYGLISSWTFNFASPTAYDDIGNHDGTYMGGVVYPINLGGHPIPYNLALKCDGSGTNSYVKIPHINTVFNQIVDGTFEAWIYLNVIGTLQPIFQKGTSFATTTLAAYISAGNKFGINIGPHNYVSSGHTFSAGKWYHVAATWTGGPNFTVKLYVNGVLDATQNFNGAMPTNTDAAWIGRYHSTDRFNGYIDEVRIWAPALTQEQIKNNMIISGRALLPNSQLVGCWNFDGNLRNWTAITGVDGSFNTGPDNDCRLSGYSNETNAEPYTGNLNAHTTVLNDNYVAQAYFRGKSGLPIPDLGYVQDTIKVTKWPGNVTSVEVLISIQHTYCTDLDIRITAPNGQTRDISTDNGGGYDNGYLTIFNDGFIQLVTGTTFLSPWTNQVKPEVVMGTFGGSTLNGNWILRVTDDASGDVGTLMGWGLRFNGSTSNISPISSNIPEEYKLHQNYPNPFNPITNINFDIPKAGIVSIKVYDITGREISTLVNQSVKAGSYNVEFDATNLASGTYFYKIQAGNFTDVKKMMLIK